ncbi:unnamed protein product [Mytilus edulis]|uniref:Uncharacterized protein n=1 Tax=Mytilus edulis TaxID=6550 RepID=A0A8S3PUE9_MYTED|nr:unnamed protein product [Mytilus edulis]
MEDNVLIVGYAEVPNISKPDEQIGLETKTNKTDRIRMNAKCINGERDIIIPEHSKFVIKGIAHVRNTCNNTSAVFMLEGNFDIPEELRIKESLVRCGNGSSPKIHVVVQNASAHDVILPKNVNMGMLQNVKGVFGIPDKDTYTQDISKDDNNEQLWDPLIEIVQIKCFIHIVTGDETNYLYLGWLDIYVGGGAITIRNKEIS